MSQKSYTRTLTGTHRIIYVYIYIAPRAANANARIMREFSAFIGMRDSSARVVAAAKLFLRLFRDTKKWNNCIRAGIEVACAALRYLFTRQCARALGT